jgi:hypothetical protein
MKKLIILGAVLINTISCIAQKTECEQGLQNWINYEDTIKIEFVGIDSSIFKGKDYKLVADSLFFKTMDKYRKCDIRDIQTGYIHRIWFERKKYNLNNLPYDPTIYEEVLRDY